MPTLRSLLCFLRPIDQERDRGRSREGINVLALPLLVGLPSLLSGLPNLLPGLPPLLPGLPGFVSIFSTNLLIDTCLFFLPHGLLDLRNGFC